MFRRLFAIGWLLAGCWFAFSGNVVADESDDVYLNHIKPLLKTKCYACHGAIKQEAELRLDTGPAIRSGGDSGPAVDLDHPVESLLLQRITSDDDHERMPPGGAALSNEQIEMVSRWIQSGGHSPKGEKAQVDPGQHWAFQSLGRTDPPGNPDDHPVDAFIRSRLAANGLAPAQPADSRTLIRRLYFDLHGLPPSYDEIRKFELAYENDSRRANDQLIDHLLASPRYGERWAQHWLDLVRYADTHGYEVNTPRANAWPYRDYVIRAFNENKPFDKFIFEQLAGDSVGEDAATGFLVAAAVLLPGQIGKDAASIRLARQDALDEMIIGTSATFLGLTVGCARCHDHKFDPISQQDYYAMQAFFAGVDYGDRPLRDENQKQRERESADLAPKIAALTQHLRQFEPVSFTGRTIILDDEDESQVTLLAEKNGHGINPAGPGRGYKDDLGTSQRVANISGGRYTWWNNQPGLDVFSWDPAVKGRFRLWISWGAHGSGVHTRDARYLIDHDGDLETRDDQHEVARIDQYYVSGVSAGESAKTPLWSGLYDAGVHQWTEKTRLVLRSGDTGTGITADVIVLQESIAGDGGQHSLPRLRNAVDPGGNTERFSPVDGKFVRFTIEATSNHNKYEPCIDEIQVFQAADALKNVALASAGTKATASGNIAKTGKHQISHINDGRFGNSYSWISNEKGRGWVQLEFPQVESIDCIEWARDREGDFKDRWPVDYRIEVSIDGKKWLTVAGSEDRAPEGTPPGAIQTLVRNAPDNSRVAQVVKDLEQLKNQKAQLDKPRLVYAGIMREPDKTHVLMRGDPEQPLEEIAARTLSLLGGDPVQDLKEQNRRIQLAKWIVDADNPLTARVIVNRVWQYHFGRGLVDTASDFGLNGSPPSHPELLDWLARDLVEHGWSLNHLHRRILSSATYQQSNAIDSQAQSIDADARLLWRFPARRLEAEAIRDSILQVSGQLNLEMGGRGFDFFKSRGGLSGFPPVRKFDRDSLRRMIYAHKVRMETVPVFGAFDCPDAGQPMPKRSQSTTAIQALNLFNSEFVVEQARRFSEQVISQAGDSIDKQVELVFLNSLGRSPTSVELAATSSVVQDHGLAVLCRVIFNSNEFLFIP